MSVVAENLDDQGDGQLTFEQVQLQEKIRRVRVLLATKDDYLPQPRGVELASAPGPAPGRRVPCGACRRTGKVVVGRGPTKRLRRCLGCDGTGWRRRRAGELGYDEYLDREGPPKPLSSLSGPSRAMDAREVDHELARLHADALRREGVVSHERYGWERGREVRDVAGSYRELERAQQQVARAYPLVPRGSGRWLELVTLSMRGTIRVPRWAEEELADERRATILALLRSEWSPRQIGKALGMSKEKVMRIAKAGVRSGALRSARPEPPKREA